MAELKPKISIIGCGNVGIRYAYALIIKGLARKLILVDLDKKRLEGEVMDLCHTAPYTQPVEIIAGDYSDIKDSDLIVITAGKKQKPSQSRIELVEDNVKIYEKMIAEIMKYSPSSIILIVSNPVDILSYAAYKFSSKPHKEIIGSGTVLDTARFRFLLADHCDVDPRNIHAYILGEHGDTEFAVWSKAMIGGMLFDDYCPTCKNYDKCDRKKVLTGIFDEVKNSAYEIIEKKGETSYGIGLAMVRITQAILNDENAVLPVSSLVDDYLGIQDIYLSRPTIVNRQGVREVLQIELSDEEEEAFKKSASSLKKIIKDIGL
jgi:L-lactate dehydrogenase